MSTILFFFAVFILYLIIDWWDTSKSKSTTHEQTKEDEPVSSNKGRKLGRLNKYTNTPPKSHGNMWMSKQEKLTYFASPKWKSMRQLILSRDNHQCQSCGAKSSLEIHHITYENFGDEDISQLVSLCRDCHQEIHDLNGYSRDGYYPL